MVSDAGEGICSVCDTWGTKMLNAAVRTHRGPAVIADDEGLPRKACRNCIEDMVSNIIKESRKRHGHSGIWPPGGEA